MREPASRAGGSKLRRVYDAARTPFERVLESELGDPAKLAPWPALRKTLDPFQLALAIEKKLPRIEVLAKRRLSPGRHTAARLHFR